MSQLLEAMAVLTGILYLVGAVQQWRGCWIAGGASALCFGVLFWRAGLPFQAALQGYYLAVAVHGWIHWGKTDEQSHVVAPIVRWPLAWHGLVIVAVLAVSVVSLALRPAATDTLAVLDAFTAWGSVAATWMVARKVLENWLYWIVIDAAAVYLYLQSGLVGTAALFALYTGLAAAGWVRWKKSAAAN